MYKLEITLSDDVARKLEKMALKLQVSPEELVASSLEETIKRYTDFQDATQHVLDKNAELYKRLA